MVTTLQTQLGSPTPMILPLLDQDGDFAFMEVEPNWKWCAGQYWSDAIDPVDPVEYMQANGANELSWASLASLCQVFQYNNLEGWGELSGTAGGESAGSWREPIESVGVG